MNITEWIAIIISILSAIIAYKSDLKTRNFENYKERIRIIERKEDNFMTKEELNLIKNENRINLMPYFHLVFDKKITVVDKVYGGEILELPISLVNMGREAATNIMLKPYSEEKPLDNYFKINDYAPHLHRLREYFDKQYAVSGDMVSFTACCERHKLAYNVYFKINYDDLVGRTYEQEFRFQYGYAISEKFSMNHTTFLPVCIDDKDKTLIHDTL